MDRPEPLRDLDWDPKRADGVKKFRDFLEEAFSYAGLHWQDHVKVDPKYFRPAEVDVLQGDPSKARKALGWSPRVSFKELVRLMVDAELEQLL